MECLGSGNLEVPGLPKMVTQPFWPPRQPGALPRHSLDEVCGYPLHALVSPVSPKQWWCSPGPSCTVCSRAGQGTLSTPKRQMSVTPACPAFVSETSCLNSPPVSSIKGAPGSHGTAGHHGMAEAPQVRGSRRAGGQCGCWSPHGFQREGFFSQARPDVHHVDWHPAGSSAPPGAPAHSPWKHQCRQGPHETDPSASPTRG